MNAPLALTVPGLPFPLMHEPLSSALVTEFGKYFLGAVKGDTSSCEASFDAAAGEFFDKEWSNHEKLDEYFKNFTPLWGHLLEHGGLYQGREVWEWALRPVLGWEGRNPGKQLHKGSCFYYAGMTAIVARDIDGGYLFMHAALQEDIRKSHDNNPAPDSPSAAFVVMDADKVAQTFRVWVVAQAQRVETELSRYRSQHGRALTFAELRKKFLAQPALREAAYLFSHSVARIMRLEMHERVTRSALDSDFAAQLGLGLMFDFTLVTDALIKPHYPGNKMIKRGNNGKPAMKRGQAVLKTHLTFFDLAEHLSDKAGLQLSEQDLKDINAAFNGGLDAGLVSMLGGTHVVSGQGPIGGLKASLAVAYGCRNSGAHTVSASTILRSRFVEVRAALLDTVFLAVETFY